MKNHVALYSLLIVILASGCGDETPDGDVQYRCDGDYAAELCVHAANAAAELQPHVNYQIVVSDPDVLGVTWRSADQWRITVVPAGYELPPDRWGGDVVRICPDGYGALAATSYPRRTIYIGECVVTDAGWDLGTVVRHEIGHSLGVVGHPAGGHVMAADLPWGSKPRVYDDHDVEMIAAVRRGERNDILEAIWID